MKILTLFLLTYAIHCAENQPLQMVVKDGVASINGIEVVYNMSINDFLTKILGNKGEPYRFKYLDRHCIDEKTGLLYSFTNQEKIYYIGVTMESIRKGKCELTINGVKIGSAETTESISAKFQNSAILPLPRVTILDLGEKSGNTAFDLEKDGKTIESFGLILLKKDESKP